MKIEVDKELRRPFVSLMEHMLACVDPKLLSFGQAEIYDFLCKATEDEAQKDKTNSAPGYDFDD